MQKTTERNILQGTIDLDTELSWKRVSHTVSGFENEPQFIELLQGNGIDPHNKTTLEYADGLMNYTHDYCTTYSSTLSASEISQLTLIANAPYLGHVQQQLNYYELQRKQSKRLSDTEWTEYKEVLKPYAVWYNQLLSDHIYEHPETTFSELNRALIEQTLNHFPYDENGVERGVKATTRGARKEAVTRQMLDQTPVDYVPGTPEDDLKGGDIIITYKGQRVKVDIKSSLQAIAEIRGGYDEIETQHVMYAISRDTRKGKDNKFNSIIIYPGFTDDDLGDHCYLSPDILLDRAYGFAVQLQRACIEAEL